MPHDNIVQLRKDNSLSKDNVLNSPAMLRELADQIEQGLYSCDVGVGVVIRRPNKVPDIRMYGEVSTEDFITMLEIAKQALVLHALDLLDLNG